MSEYEIGLYRIIGEMIRDVRTRRGFTLEQVAEQLGVVPKTLQRYETGASFLHRRDIMKFTDVCKVVASLILGLSILGGFFVAEKQSKKIEYGVDYFGKAVTEEVKDDITYFVVLVSTWVAGGILTLIIYGMGEVVRILGNVTYYLDKINNKLNK